MGSQRVGHDWSDWARKHVHLLSIINGYHWDKFSQLRCHLLRRSSWPLYSKYPIPYAAVAAVVLLSHVWLFLTSWAIAPQVPLSMGFPRQEFWSELPFPSPRDLPDTGIEPMSPAWQVDSLPQSHLGSPFYTSCLQVVLSHYFRYFFSGIYEFLVFVFSHSVVSDSLQPHGLQHAKLLSPSLSRGVCPRNTSF